MKKSSRFTHLYRLGLVGIAALIIFLALVYIMSPASWNYEIAHWYRVDSLQQMQQLPMGYGGIEDSTDKKVRNATCVECHPKTVEQFQSRKHARLSCEDCHGALADHAQNGKKVADARLVNTRQECLICHADLVNKPKRFPTFRTTEKYIKHRELISGEFPEGTTCLKCHDAHDPTP